MRNRFWVLAFAGAAAGMCAGLAGCADYGRLSHLAREDVDPESASVAAVQGASARAYAYPDLRKLPPKPKDLRAPAAYAAEAKTLTGSREALNRWAATHPAEHDDSEGFAEGQRGRVLDPKRAAPPEDQAQRSEDWAAKMRTVGEPPPPVPK